jgi:Cys-rich repeat protein
MYLKMSVICSVRSLSLGISILSLGWLGCNEAKPCVAMGGESELLSTAQFLRVDVYGERAHCDESSVAAGAPAAQLSLSFYGGQPISLGVAAGKHTIVLSTYADSAGTQLIGVACTEAAFVKGQSACVALTLARAPDGGGGCQDDTGCTGGLSHCAPDHRCVACVVNDHCTTGAAVYCDPSRSQCVECRTNADCKEGLICSAAGVCSQSCDLPAGQNCPSGLDCCGNLCVNTRSDALNCGGCGMACTGSDTLCCNGECANPATSTTHCGGCGNTCSTLNATPSCSGGGCMFSCRGAFIHCMNGNTGCETPSNSVSNCGGCGNACMPNNATSGSCGSTKCSYECAIGFGDCIKIGTNTDGCETPLNDTTNCGGCGNTCDVVHSNGAVCNGTMCTYTGCQAGYVDCSSAGANADGCETLANPPHMNGLGQMYDLPCAALGMPGNDSSYSLAMAQAASAAWASDGMTGTLKCTSSQCVTNTNGGMCAVWCYTKKAAGNVQAGATCQCPGGNDASWN